MFFRAPKGGAVILPDSYKRRDLAALQKYGRSKGTYGEREREAPPETFIPGKKKRRAESLKQNLLLHTATQSPLFLL